MVLITIIMIADAATAATFAADAAHWKRTNTSTNIPIHNICNRVPLQKHPER